MRLKAKMWIFALIWFMQGCNNYEPAAEDYDQSCQADEDCVMVLLHRNCECEEQAAINKRDQAKCEQDNKEAIESADTECQPSCLFDKKEAYCNAGTCQLRLIMDQP